MRSVAIFFVCASLLSASTAIAANDAWNQNWPQWRGPTGNGVAIASDAPVKWSETENIRWKTNITGRGHATPIIWGEKVFTLSAAETDRKGDAPGGDGGAFAGRVKSTDRIHQYLVSCLDRRTGKVIWQHTARQEMPHEGHFRIRGSFASASPVTDGEHLYVFFGSAGLYCYDFDGNLVWETDLGKFHMRRSFGEGASPGLHGNTLFINGDQERDSYLYAIDKRNGKTLWKVPREEPSSWATPVIVEHDGDPQVILPATNRIRAYSADQGKLIWACNWSSGNVISTPVVGHGLVFLSTGHKKYSLKAVRLSETGDISNTDAVVWSLDAHTPYVPSPMLHGDNLYLLRDNGYLGCYDARTGKPHFEQERLPRPHSFSASPVAAGDKIYLLSERGACLVLKAGNKLQILAENLIDGDFFASPAIVENELFLRSDTTLYCIQQSDPATSQ
jgi:outer membrane protein assembly factor BamB